MELNIKRLTEEEFAKFAKLIYDESGIFLKDTKLTLLSNRLRKRLYALKLEEFSEYYSYLTGLQGEAKIKEYEELLDVVSTNETYFFRNERHFEAFTEHVLPDMAQKKTNKRLRIWSAACSTGEEPYTLAICVLEKKHLFPGWKIEILGTDIAPSVLDFAHIGEYSGRRIEKVPPQFLTKYFDQKKDDTAVYKIKKEVQDLTRFYYLNFFKNEFPTDIDIIFCRNVMIYFNKEYQQRLVKGFSQIINPEGYLFIGHSETLHSISNDFVYNKILESPVYTPKIR